MTGGSDGGSEVEQLLVRPEEGARAINVSRATFYAMLARGEIPSVTIGRSRRIPAEALRRWVATRVAEQTGSAAPSAGDRNAA